jgi:hypothetical protein
MNKAFVLLGGTIAGLSCLGVLSILLVVIKHPDSSTTSQAILQIVAILSPTIIALVGAFKSIETDKTVTTKVEDLKTTVTGNSEHLEQQAAKVEDLHEQIATVNVKADIAAQTAVKLADKVEKLNGK